MNAKRLIGADSIYFSALFGLGVYRWNGEMVQDPLRGEGKSPLLTNIRTGEQYFAKKIGADKDECRRYEQMILNPISPSLGLWPVDMVALNLTQQEGMDLFVRQEYRDIPSNRGAWQGDGALLFPYGGHPQVTVGERLVPPRIERGWKEERVRRMAVGVTTAIDLMNRSGYAYFDMHLSRLFFRDDDSVYLDFSNLIYPTALLGRSGLCGVCSPQRDEYPLEFAEPAYAQRKTLSFDMRTQNYSLAAMLFYLLMGRYAYDGSLYEHLPDDTVMNHYTKMERYLEGPVFVFDENDRDNALDLNERRSRGTIELWESLPAVLKEMLSGALSQPSAERTGGEGSPAPDEWLHEFSKLGWNKGWAWGVGMRTADVGTFIERRQTLLGNTLSTDSDSANNVSQLDRQLKTYAKDIELIRRGIGQAEISGEALSKAIISTLELLVAADIPKAQYLMGYCMLRGLMGDEAEEKGLELITKAAGAGDVEAAAELGDYYYRAGEDDKLSDGWEKALDYYTGFGSLALSAGRRERVINILNHATFNKRTIDLCVPLLCVMALLAFLSIGSPVYASHLVLGIAIVVVCVFILVSGIHSNKDRPYRSNYRVPVLIFMAWSLYMAVRMFFY